MKEAKKKQTASYTDLMGLDKDFDYLTNACSACDCTGLIPANPMEDGALDSYQDVYAYQPPKIVSTAETKEHDRQ